MEPIFKCETICVGEEAEVGEGKLLNLDLEVFHSISDSISDRVVYQLTG